MATMIKGRRFDADYTDGERNYLLGSEGEVSTDDIRENAEVLVEQVNDGSAMFSFEVCGIWYDIATGNNGVAALWATDADPFGTWKNFATVGELCDWFDELVAASKEA